MIGIITTNFGRIPVLRIFCEGVKRLREETRQDIPCVCVGDIDGAEVCREYDIIHIEFPNNPLTSKFNRACKEMKTLGMDNVMIMGSDNLLSTNTFKRIQEEADKGIDLIGLNDVYFFGMDDIYSSKLIYFGCTTVLGVGRTISKSVLYQVDWTPWNIERNRAIDTIMLDCVRPHVKTRTLLTGGHVFDLKSNMNLNRIDFWHKKLGNLPTADILWNNIGEEETTLIKEYLDRQKK